MVPEFWGSKCCNLDQIRRAFDQIPFWPKLKIFYQKNLRIILTRKNWCILWEITKLIGWDVLTFTRYSGVSRLREMAWSRRMHADLDHNRFFDEPSSNFGINEIVLQVSSVTILLQFEHLAQIAKINLINETSLQESQKLFSTSCVVWRVLLWAWWPNPMEC